MIKKLLPLALVLLSSQSPIEYSTYEVEVGITPTGLEVYRPTDSSYLLAATFEAVLPEIPINSRNIVGATITFSGDARLIFKYENADLTYTEDKEAFIVNNLIESNLQIDNIHYITATGRARDIRFISGMPDFNIDGVGTGGRRFIIPGSIFGVKSFNQEVAALLAAGTVLHGELDTYSSLVTEDLTWVIYIANAGNYKVNIIYYYI